MCDPPEALAQPKGAPQNLGPPNRQWGAYLVPPGWVEAGSERPHPAPPGTDTGRFRGSVGGGGGLRSKAVGLGRWVGAGLRTRVIRWSARLGCVLVCVRGAGTGTPGSMKCHRFTPCPIVSPQNMGPGAAVRCVVSLPGGFVAEWRP